MASNILIIFLSGGLWGLRGCRGGVGGEEGMILHLNTHAIGSNIFFYPFILIFSFYIWVVNEDDLYNHDVSCRLSSYFSPAVFWCMVLKLLWFTLLQILVFSCLNNSLELSKEISWGQLTHFHQKPDILEMARKQLRGTGAAYSAVCQPSPGTEPGPWDSCQPRCCWGSWGSISLLADHR